MSEPGPVRLRPAAAGDVPAIAAIYGHHVRTGLASFELEPPDAAEMARRHAAILARGLPFLVADQGGTIAGYAYLDQYRDRPGYRHTLETSVYVAPGATGRGIGGRLLDALIVSATALGHRQVVAVIGDSANRASIALHARAGFRHVGTLTDVGRKHGRWIDVVIMQRALGPGATSAPSTG